MNKQTYTLLENYMLSCMEDSAHDKEHIYRVLYNGLEIAKTESDVDKLEKMNWKGLWISYDNAG